MRMNLQPAEVVDYALVLADRGELNVHKLGTFAGWNPVLLCRAHNELVDRQNLANIHGLSWKELHRYRGVIHALSMAHDNAVAGPRRRRAA
jgi:hypothetical protein